MDSNKTKALQDALKTALASSELPPTIKNLLGPYMQLTSAIAKISPRGNGAKVKTCKPKDALWSYVWRMARFNVGDDMTLPMTAEFALSSALKSHLPDAGGWDGVKFNINSEQSRENRGVQAVAAKLLDSVSMASIAVMGLNPYQGANRWHRAFNG